MVSAGEMPTFVASATLVAKLSALQPSIFRCNPPTIPPASELHSSQDAGESCGQDDDDDPSTPNITRRRAYTNLFNGSLSYLNSTGQTCAYCRL